MAFASPLATPGYLKYTQHLQHKHEKEQAVSSLHHNSKALPQSRARKLQRLADRENHLWRRDRVLEYVTQRIELSEQRYKAHVAEAKKVIQTTVDSIVEDPSFVFKGKRLISSRSKDLLGSLENKLIQDLAAIDVAVAQQKRCQPGGRGSKVRRSSSSSQPFPALSLSTGEGGQQQQPTEQGAQNSAGALSTRRSNATTVLEKLDTWQLINAFQSFNAQQEDETRKAAKMKRVAEYREYLDRQRKEQDDVKQRIQAEMLKAREEQAKAHEQWRNEQESLKQKVERSYLEEKAMRIETIVEKERRREQDKTEKVTEERAVNDVHERLRKEEEERKRRRKLEERKRQELIEEENRREREKRKLLELEVAREDLRLMEEYAKKLAKEEEERKAAFSHRVVKMKSQGDKWATEGAGKQQEELRIRQERSIMEAALKKDQADQERERRDLEKKKRDKQKMAEDNLSMSRRHQEEQRVAKAAESAEMQRVRREAAEAKAKELRERMEARAKQREYVNYLRKQMEDGNRQRAQCDISEKERLLNRQLLDQAEGDEHFIDYCQKQLLPALEGSAARRRSSVLVNNNMLI